MHKTKYLLVICLVLITAALAFGYKPERIAGTGQQVDLRAIPAQVGIWRMVDEESGVTFAQDFLNDVLMRVYQRPDGRVVQLAIAYGADQRQNFSIHVPEGCYRAGGFDVTTVGLFSQSEPALQLKQLFVRSDKRTEALQYWIVLNGQVVTSHFERKIRQVWYSVLGARAGGVLVRVSSVSTDRDFRQEYTVQQDFIHHFYNALNQEQRRILFGEEHTS